MAFGSTSRQGQGETVDRHIEFLGVKKKSLGVTESKMMGSNLSGHSNPRCFSSASIGYCVVAGPRVPWAMKESYVWRQGFIWLTDDGPSSGQELQAGV